MMKSVLAALAALALGVGTAHAEASLQAVQDGLLGKECIAAPQHVPSAAIQSFIGQKGPDGGFVVIHAYAKTTAAMAGNHAIAGWPWVHDAAPKRLEANGSDAMFFTSDQGGKFNFHTAGNGITVTLDVTGYQGIGYEMSCTPAPVQPAQAR